MYKHVKARWSLKRVLGAAATLVLGGSMVMLGAGAASASATASNGPVTLKVVGTGLNVTSSATSHSGPSNGPVIGAAEWTIDGAYYVQASRNIGYVCVSSTSPFNFSFHWFDQGTTLKAEWYEYYAWDAVHIPSVGIHA